MISIILTHPSLNPPAPPPNPQLKKYIAWQLTGILWVVLQVMKRDAVSCTVLIRKYISEFSFLKLTKQIKLKFVLMRYCVFKRFKIRTFKKWLWITRRVRIEIKSKERLASSIFNGFNRLNPARRNLESDPSYHLWKKVLKKIANDGSLTDVFILMDVHTQKPKIQTEWALQSRFGREKSH